MGDREELIEQILDDIEVFGPDKDVYMYAVIEDGETIVYDYSYQEEGMCIDPISLEELLIVLGYDEY